MVNTAKFSKRLKKILDYYELTASAFADKIAVQRSSISHLLSGRNKPSLDFILKILDNFDEVNFEWLVKGEGEFSPLLENDASPTLFNQDMESTKTVDNKKEPIFRQEIISDANTSKNKKPSKIILFYKDGSFETFDA